MSLVDTWPFTLPPLRYGRSALAPMMSAETLDAHHGEHHAGYVEKLNALVAGTALTVRRLEDIIRNSEGPTFNNAAQHWNHSFFWNCLSPQGGGEPTGALTAALAGTWGSTGSFREAFAKTALDTFGSGWAWLVERDGALEILSTKDAGTPLTERARPLLALDLWEHAYYLDHRGDRSAYLASFWKLVNWRHVSQELQAAADNAPLNHSTR